MSVPLTEFDARDFPCEHVGASLASGDGLAAGLNQFWKRENGRIMSSTNATGA